MHIVYYSQSIIVPSIHFPDDDMRDSQKERKISSTLRFRRFVRLDATLDWRGETMAAMHTIPIAFRPKGNPLLGAISSALFYISFVATIFFMHLSQVRFSSNANAAEPIPA